MRVVDNPNFGSGADPVYKGLAMGTVGKNTLLYAPNFRSGKILEFRGQPFCRCIIARDGGAKPLRRSLMPRTRSRLLLGALLLPAAFTVSSFNAIAAPQSEANFAPLESWRAAVLAGDATGLKALYSVNPPATVATPAGKSTDVAAEVQFWSAMKANGLGAVVLSEIHEQSSHGQSPRDDMQQTVFQTELTTRTKSGPRKLYISVGILWHRQGDAWRIVSSQRDDPARLPQPFTTKKDLYRADADASAEIRAALGRAASGHKRILLVFGGNWCYDCHVLEAAFHSAEIVPLVARSYEVVHVDVGEYNKNLDLAERYEVPLKKGVPAIAVLESNGKLLYSQKGGEFEKARSMGPEDIVAFLRRWKP